ncbi:MAG: hypothetical protein WCJ30_25035, partial [Deltaproteobacteria bacterium]
GVVVVTQQPRQQPGMQPVPVPPPPNEPPPRRTSMFAAAPTFHLPLVGVLAGQRAYGGGINVHVGYALGNVSIAFSPALLYYGNGEKSEAYFTLGAIARYTLLREAVIHPFGEIGIDLGIPIAHGGSSGPTLTERAFALGVSAAIGAELDLSDNFSLQLAARATACVDIGHLLGDVMFTPFLGLVYYR